jgi:hypothetical protein
MSKLQGKPSALKREHTALKNVGNLLTFINACGSFLPSWIRIHSTGNKYN